MAYPRFALVGLNLLRAILANYQDPKSLYAILERNEVGLICNLAAYTDVNSCEANFDLAYQANCGIVETLAKWCAESPNRHLIQISTDHVYDAMGASKEPDVRILNGYAMSKYAGELAARCVDATVLRVTSLVRIAVKKAKVYMSGASKILK